MELGASTNIKDRHGQTPLDYAIRAGSSKMACALQRLMKVPEENWVSRKELVDRASHFISVGLCLILFSFLPSFSLYKNRYTRGGQKVCGSPMKERRYKEKVYRSLCYSCTPSLK